MTKNKIAYALIAAVFAVSIASVSFATAEPSQKDVLKFKADGIAGFRAASMMPEITGTVNVGDDMLAKAKTGLSEAVTSAESDAKGTATSANLGVQNGYLVYNVSVLSSGELKTVIIDAGNGKVLHISDGIPVDAFSMLTTWHPMGLFHQAAPVAFQVDESFTPDQE